MRFAKYGIAASRIASRDGPRRQGLGGARPRRRASQAGSIRRATADARIRPAPTQMTPADAIGRRADHAAGVDAGLHRHRSRHDSDRARGARRAADGRELRVAREQGILHEPDVPSRRARTSSIQGGDPRGDGEGGPGYTIRDEINQRPYLRGTVGMALDWADTGGSQFFITHSPQPHLDAKYTVIRPRRRRHGHRRSDSAGRCHPPGASVGRTADDRRDREEMMRLSSG